MAHRLRPVLDPVTTPEMVVAASTKTVTGATSNDKNPSPSRRPGRCDREALGRSRGGLATKLHLLADRRCRPLTRVTTAGQRHDATWGGRAFDCGW
jgi:hypothetical protein